MLVYLGPIAGKHFYHFYYLQSCAKYLRQTLVFMSNRAPRENFNFLFQEFFASTEKNSFLE